MVTILSLGLPLDLEIMCVYDVIWDIPILRTYFLKVNFGYIAVEFHNTLSNTSFNTFDNTSSGGETCSYIVRSRAKGKGKRFLDPPHFLCGAYKKFGNKIESHEGIVNEVMWNHNSMLNY